MRLGVVFAWLTAFALGFACAAPGPQRVDPRFVADLDAVEQALERGEDAQARLLIDKVQARKPTGAALQRASRLESVLAEREFAPYASTLEALDGALRDHDQAVARRVLERLESSGAPASVRERAAAYERIVAGRELVATLSLTLAAEPTSEPGVWEVALVAQHQSESAIRLRCKSGSLSFLATGVDPTGLERRSAVNAFVDVLADVELPAHETRRIPLGQFSLAVEHLIASRGRWELALNAGTLEVDNRELPAMHVAVAPCEVVRRDPRLPTTAVEPSELVRYVQIGAPSTAALLERAVRIDNARRAEALEAVIPAALALDDDNLKRVVPALRWLGAEREIGGDPRVWRVWLEARLAAGARRSERFELDQRASRLAAHGR